MITFKFLREKSNLTIDQLSKLTDIKPTTLKKYESSERIPINKNLITLRNIFKCSEEELMQALMFHKSKNLKIYSGYSKKNKIK